jgi:FAD/FMN-containing dehydrogenase
MDPFLQCLRDALGGDRVSTVPADLATASRDESDLPPVAPRCVARPVDTAGVAAIVRACRDAGVPLTARGGGTSLEGSSVPSPGAVVLDLAGMDRVLEASVEERLAVVQAGVVFDRLNERLRPTGLFFPPTPGGSADAATVGGMVATDAGGLFALRFGGTRRWVRGLEVVTGDGSVMRTGCRVPKASAGPDLTHLFVASEGTLGIVTEVTLGLCPVPEARRRGGWVLPGMPAACRAVADLLMAVPDLAAVEVVDGGTVGLFEGAATGDARAGDLLLVEAHGRPAEADAALAACLEAVLPHGAWPLDPAAGDPWDLRHRLTRAVRESAGGAGVVRTDAAVPLPALPSFVDDVLERAASAGRRAHVFGHAGLGILHVLMPLGGPGAWTRPEALGEKTRLCARAAALGGTVSGEHGIGLANREALARGSAGTLPWLAALKAVFDPAGILNPDKVFDAGGGGA